MIGRLSAQSVGRDDLRAPARDRGRADTFDIFCAPTYDSSKSHNQA